ncbi:hypothetical protein D3C72_1917760 [compost metagenome]
MLIQDRAQLNVNVLRPAWCVMNMQHAFRRAAVPGLAHRAQLTGLIAWHRIVMGNPMTFTADRRLAFHRELSSIGSIGGEDVVVGIQHDGRLSVVFEIRHQRLYGRIGNNW